MSPLRTRADVEAQLDGAWRVVGVHAADTGEMGGFARADSDGVAFAYLADVVVLPAHRGQGLGAGFRWTLHTAEAHGLYRRFGFREPDATYLERPRPGS